jgi:hypothetical protein
MMVNRLAGMMAAALVVAGMSTPASAQFFLRNPTLPTGPVRGDEPELGYKLPGATEAELRAGVVWSMRAALNVAALQCQFEPTLRTVDNYNAILFDHKAELAQALDTLNKYFIRVNNKNRAKGITAFDHFGERLYSGFSTVTAQYIFCLTAGSIARDAVFAPRGKFGEVAVARMREVRYCLKPAGEQQFPMRGPIQVSWPFGQPTTPADCWTRKNKWDTKKCGPQPVTASLSRGSGSAQAE